MNPMGHKGGHKILPFMPMGRWGDIGFPPEMRLGPAGQFLGHKTQLHKGAYPGFQQKIKQTVDILEIVADGSVPPVYHAHIVVQQPVEADVLEAAVSDDLF